MNTIETLPRIIYFNEEMYFIYLGVTFRGVLTIGYKDTNRKHKICSWCVEPNNEPYIPEGFDSSVGFNENIGNHKTLDDCVEQIKLQLEKHKHVLHT